MPIPVPPALSTYILNNFLYLLQDPDKFEGTFDWVIGKWADVCEQLLSTVIPVSTLTTTARAAFITAMAPLPTAGAGAIVLLQGAFMQYATVLAGGMVPAGFVGTPPPAPPLIAPLVVIPQPSETFALALETVLITWAKTGTATPVVGGSPIPWT